MRLGIFGGTFDPIHLGHLRSAEEIGEQLDLNKVYVMPSASPPHKTGDPITGFRHRLAMVRLAVGQSDRLEVLDLEGRRSGHSYSIETLKEMTRIHGPHADLFFLLGVDAFLDIQTWKDWESLFDLTHFVIIRRLGSDSRGLHPLLHRLKLAPILTGDTYIASSGKTVAIATPTRMEISSTRIREMVRKGKSIRFLVPEEVRTYILENRLY